MTFSALLANFSLFRRTIYIKITTLSALLANSDFQCAVSAVDKILAAHRPTGAM